MRHILCALPVMLMLAACNEGTDPKEMKSCMDFLYDNMTLDDDLVYTREFWENNVRNTLQTRKRMGWDIPEREFMHFVLPLRSMQGHPDDFRTTYSDTLCRRVRGLSMADAALEINHWCREQAIYNDSKRPADSPMGTVWAGYGTCTELTELLACALRAVGIPARQVCVTWPHKSGAHSWVEVYVDGRWHFMGGCEPACRLDVNWIYDYAPRVMLARIFVTGDYDGPETTLGKARGFTLISSLGNYAPVKNLIVEVHDAGGKPVSGAEVSFLVGKDKSKSVIYTIPTDGSGRAWIETGYGDCAIMAGKDGLWGAAKACSRETYTTVTLNQSEEEATLATEDMELVAPAPGIAPGTPEDWSGWAENSARVAADDSIRTARFAEPYS